MTERSRVKAVAPYLRWLFAALVLAFLFSRFPGSEVLQILGGVHLGWAAGAVALTLASQVVVAMRLQLYARAQGIRFSIGQLLGISLSTTFYSMVLPGGSMPANAIKFYRISAPGKEYAGAAVALLMDRLAATLALSAVGVVAWLVERPADGLLALAVMGAACALIVGVQLALRTDATSRLGEWLLNRLPAGLRARDAKEMLRAVSLSTEAVIAGLSVLTHIISIAAYVCIARSLELDIGFVTIAWTRSAAILVAMLPVSVAGLGVRESAFLVMLAPYGILGEQAIAFSLAIFVLTIVALGMIGGIIEARRLVVAGRAGPG